MGSFGLPPPADDVAPRGTKAWKQAVNARRAAVANRLWSAQHYDRLNLSDPNAMSDYLARMGITSEVGGGRHLRRLFMGDLPSEGFGMSNVPGRGGMSYAMEAYMPDWKFNLDRAIQGGMPRLEANAQFIPGAGTSSFFPGGPVSAPMASGPSVPGLTGSSASYAPNPQDDDEAMAKAQLFKRRPGMSLGSLSGLGG